jgi:two-component system nitrate/nitrite response regulator NarL
MQTTQESLIEGQAITQRGPLLTDREREVSASVQAGLANKIIALRLGVSEGTVKSHLNQVYRKLGVRNRIALIIRGLDV